MVLDRFIVAGAFAALGVGNVGLACPPPTDAGVDQGLVASESPAPGTIVDVAHEAGTFKTLLAAVKAAGLADTLAGKGPFTVFAPTDEAFAKLGKKTLGDLLKPENLERLKAILTYHVVAARVEKSDAVKVAKAGAGAATVNGQRAPLALDQGVLRVAGAKVVAADVEASNGVIHVIDTVLMPATDDLAQTAMKAGKFNTLVAAAKAAGLVEALKGTQPLTVFAPTDEAFSQLPEGLVAKLLKPENKEALKSILLYHIVAGRTFADGVLASKSLDTLQGGTLTPALDGKQARINQSAILSTDVQASNGVIHIIDKVLLPADLKLEGLVSAESMPMPGADSPAAMIDLAISRGVPQFNAGNPEACSAIYEVTARALLAMPAAGQSASVPKSSRLALARGLKSARHMHDASERAWTLRHALDSARASMPVQ